VPSVKPVKSRVVPDGTVMPERTIVAQSALDLLAAEAAVKVQEALLWRAFLTNAASGAGVAMGTAETRTAAVLRTSPKA
jgi:hypothetical protein